MSYFIPLFSCAIIITIQYFLSHWLIKTGWFYGYAWAVGGFILIFFTFAAINFNLFKFFKLDANKNDALIKLSVVLLLLGSFWLNLKLDRFHEKYEYDTFGIKTKAIITRKYELQNKGHSYVFILKTQEKSQQRELTHHVSKGEYTRKKAGDTISIFYSPRYRGMIKIQ